VNVHLAAARRESRRGRGAATKAVGRLPGRRHHRHPTYCKYRVLVPRASLVGAASGQEDRRVDCATFTVICRASLADGLTRLAIVAFDADDVEVLNDFKTPITGKQADDLVQGIQYAGQ